ncbi:MAG TPA: cupredoxin domain-containing protein [Smithella sp.]|nr:cupredoxin domain-containing protein [Smithella sp.]
MKIFKYISLIIIFSMLFVLTYHTSQLFAVEQENVIKITAKKFEYSPNVIKLKKGVPVVLELTSLDRLHGFNCPGLSIRADINPGKVTRVKFTPVNRGTFSFFCDIFCGEGHEDMNGKIIVED